MCANIWVWTGFFLPTRASHLSTNLFFPNGNYSADASAPLEELLFISPPLQPVTFNGYGKEEERGGNGVMSPFVEACCWHRVSRVDIVT